MLDAADEFDRLEAWSHKRALDDAKRRLAKLTKPELIALWQHYEKCKLYPDEVRGFAKSDLIAEIAPHIVSDER